MKEELLREAFDRLDSDNTGYIDRQNLKDSLGTDYSPALVEQAIEKADKDCDGKISFEDFKGKFFYIFNSTCMTGFFFKLNFYGFFAMVNLLLDLFFKNALDSSREKIHHSISSQEHLELDPDDST